MVTSFDKLYSVISASNCKRRETRTPTPYRASNPKYHKPNILTPLNISGSITSFKVKFDKMGHNRTRTPEDYTRITQAILVQIPQHFYFNVRHSGRQLHVLA